MSKHTRYLNGQREGLSALAKDIHRQQIDERDRLSRMIVGRAFDLPPTEPINTALLHTPCSSVRYQHGGHVGLQYLRRSDMKRAIEAGASTANVMQRAMDSLGGTALSDAVIARGSLQLAPERPQTNNARKDKFWLVAVANQQAAHPERPNEIIDLAGEQTSLHERLQIPQTYDVQLLWLGAIAAPSIERAEYVLPLIEAQFPTEFIASPVQFLPTARRLAR